VYALGDSHAPEHHRCLGSAKQPRHPADFLGRDSADLGSHVRVVFLDERLQRLEVLRTRADELVVDQVLLDEDVHHRVVEGDVRSRADLDEHLGVVGHIDPARLDHDDLRLSFPGGLLHERGRDRVVGRRVRTRNEGHLGIAHVTEHVGHRAGTDPLQ
jgi:hypothetical protein